MVNKSVDFENIEESNLADNFSLFLLMSEQKRTRGKNLE